MSWLAWWNLIFLLPAAIAVLYVALYVSTGIDFGADSDVDADADVGADADVDSDIETEADLDHDVDHDVDADVNHDVDHDVDADHDVGHGGSILALLGLGRVPLVVFISSLLLTWGLVGMFVNQAFATRDMTDDSLGPAMYSVPIAGASAIVFTSLLGMLVARLVPKSAGSSAKRPAQLVGLDATAILPINDRFGLARVVDPQTHIAVQIECRTAPGEEPIAANETIKLMRYARGERHFFVTTPARLAQRGGDASLAAKTAAKLERQATP